MTLFEPGDGISAAFALRLAVVVATLLVFRHPAAARQVAFLGSAAASLLTGLTAFSVLRTGAAVERELLVHEASGLSLRIAVDPLSAWFLLVLALLAIPIALFSIGYISHGRLASRSAFSGGAFTALVGTTELVFAAGEAITFLFAWELMTLTNAALVATEHEARASRRAAYLYLVMSHLATGCLIAAFLMAGSIAGSLSFATLLSGRVSFEPARDLLFALFFVGFAVKAGIVPLHVWLPEAHPAAPSSISALMSGVMIKSGIYGIVRVCAFGLGTPELSWGVLVVALGAVSAVLGVLYALMQHDLKRLLAYHSIENIGIILLGLGAGGVVLATGTRQIEHLGGLLRRMPWTGLFFLIGAMAISGLPPLNGFASEWLTFQAFLFGFRGSSAPLVHFLFPVAGGLLALTAALAAACFVKAFGISFLALPRSREAAEARETSALMLGPQAFLAILCVGLGLFPGAVLRTLSTVTSSLPALRVRVDQAGGPVAMTSAVSFDYVVPVALGGALVAALALGGMLTARRTSVRRVPTWGCGGTLSARTEYTATAFSKPLMMIFAAVYRPTREVEALAKVSPYFPSEVRYRASIEPTFERYVYGPLVRAVLRLAEGMKVLQAGSLHAYLAYVIALVVSLVLFVWWTG